MVLRHERRVDVLGIAETDVQRMHVSRDTSMPQALEELLQDLAAERRVLRPPAVDISVV